MSDEPEVGDRQEAETEDPIIAALLRERDGYVQRGLDDRVALVDEQLELRGHGTSSTPKRRKSPTQQTR